MNSTGEYKRTTSAVKDLFGHDPDGIPAWQATHNILSVDVPHNHSAALSSKIVADWLSANKPTDEGSLTRIIKSHGDFGSKHIGIVQALANIGSVTGNKEAEKQVRAHFGGNVTLPYSSLLSVSSPDVHLSRGLYQPTLDDYENRSDILTQAKAKLSDPKSVGERQRGILSGYPIKSELVKMLAKLAVPGKKPPYNALRSLSRTIENNPNFYIAYKEAVDRAATQLGWSHDEVLESVYNSLLALLAHKTFGVPVDKLQQALNIDAISKGVKSHESIALPELVNAYNRARDIPKAVQRVEEKANQIATRYSRSGIVQSTDRPAFRHNAPNFSPTTGIGHKIKEAILRKLTDEGIYDPKTGKMKTAKIGEPLKLASYDQELDFVPALQRAVSSNHRLFIDHLKGVLQRSGIQPQNLMPAVHDLGGAARVGVVVMGERLSPEAKLAGAAWTGLLGRQPGMVSFAAHPHGPDSIYTFSHPDANAVRGALDSAGVTSRVLAPAGNTFQVFLFDKGRQHRQNIARALTSLGTTAEEWWGKGDVVGGNRKDMGRDQYRNTINKIEQKQAQQQPQPQQQPQQFARMFSLHLARLTGDEQAFRNAVDASPHDDAPKLIYSDWLEENGRPEDANRWRTMVQHGGDEDFHPKGYVLSHLPIASEQAIRPRQIDDIFRRMQRADFVKYHAIPDNRQNSYVTTDIPQEHFLKMVEQFDPHHYIEQIHPAVSMPLTSQQAVYMHSIRGLLDRPYGYDRAPLKIIHTGANDYLVGSPTEVFDKHKEVEDYTNKLANSKIMGLMSAVLKKRRNIQNRQRLGLEV